LIINRFSGIILDWNGTLLDDILLCVRVMNEMLTQRNLPNLSISRYQEVFSFPVKDYYRKIGFDFESEPFEIPALEFIDSYNRLVSKCLLHQDTEKVLEYFQKAGVRQYVLSAMHQDILKNCLEYYRIDQYFDHVSGLDNHFAASKAENGLRFIDALNLDVNELLLIGDTLHDYEVAQALGCQCILIANGHQSKKVLQTSGARVLDSLNQLID